MSKMNIFVENRKPKLKWVFKPKLNPQVFLLKWVPFDYFLPDRGPLRLQIPPRPHLGTTSLWTCGRWAARRGRSGTDGGQCPPLASWRAAAAATTAAVSSPPTAPSDAGLCKGSFRVILTHSNMYRENHQDDSYVGFVDIRRKGTVTL